MTSKRVISCQVEMTALRGHKAEGDRGWSRRAAPEGAIWAEVWTQSGSEACWEELHQAEVWTQSGREACWEELHQAEVWTQSGSEACWEELHQAEVWTQ